MYVLVFSKSYIEYKTPQHFTPSHSTNQFNYLSVLFSIFNFLIIGIAEQWCQYQKNCIVDSIKELKGDFWTETTLDNIMIVLFSFLSSSCVIWLTGWTWASYRAQRTAGPSPADCWREQLVAFYTFTRAFPLHSQTQQSLQQRKALPRGLLGRKPTERFGRPGLMTQPVALPLC